MKTIAFIVVSAALLLTGSSVSAQPDTNHADDLKNEHVRYNFASGVSSYWEENGDVYLQLSEEFKAGLGTTLLADFSGCTGERCQALRDAAVAALTDAVKQGVFVAVRGVRYESGVGLTLEYGFEYGGGSSISLLHDTEENAPPEAEIKKLNLRGDAVCQLGEFGPECNPCIIDVNGSLNQIVRQTMHVMKLPRGYGYEFDYDPLHLKGHAQGIVRLPNENSSNRPRFFVMGNDYTGNGTAFINRYELDIPGDSNRGRLGTNVPVGNYGDGDEIDGTATPYGTTWQRLHGVHPGGAQGIGTDWIVVAHEDKGAQVSGFQFINAVNPGLFSSAVKDPYLFADTPGAASAGIVRLESGYYLLAIFTDVDITNPGGSHDKAYLRLYHSSRKTLYDHRQEWHLLGADFVQNVSRSAGSTHSRIIRYLEVHDPTILLDAVPTPVSSFRLLEVTYPNRMLVGGDCNNNGLHHTRGGVKGACSRFICPRAAAKTLQFLARWP